MSMSEERLRELDRIARSNDFWRSSSGEHLNMILELLEEVERLKGAELDFCDKIHDLEVENNKLSNDMYEQWGLLNHKLDILGKNLKKAQIKNQLMKEAFEETDKE